MKTEIIHTSLISKDYGKHYQFHTESNKIISKYSFASVKDSEIINFSV